MHILSHRVWIITSRIPPQKSINSVKSDLVFSPISERRKLWTAEKRVEQQNSSAVTCIRQITWNIITGWNREEECGFRTDYDNQNLLEQTSREISTNQWLKGRRERSFPSLGKCFRKVKGPDSDVRVIRVKVSGPESGWVGLRIRAFGPTCWARIKK